jgi:hypothetical protein
MNLILLFMNSNSKLFYVKIQLYHSKNSEYHIKGFYVKFMAFTKTCLVMLKLDNSYSTSLNFEILSKLV